VIALSTINPEAGAFVRVTSASPQGPDQDTPAASFCNFLVIVQVLGVDPVIIAVVDVVGAPVIGTHVFGAQSATMFRVIEVFLVTTLRFCLSVKVWLPT